MKSIDLNCDLGESFGRWKLGSDDEAMPLITSANIACGAHAGDPSVMRSTVRLARRFGVSIGAHPGYPDLEGFGRRVLPLGDDELANSLLYQLGALEAICRAEGARIVHVKPHGALYHLACRDAHVAQIVTESIRLFDPTVVVFGLPNSELERAAREADMAFAAEGFVDRRYEPNGSIRDRSLPGSMNENPADAAAQALALARGRVHASDGSWLDLPVRTLCVHGDGPNAVSILKAVGPALREAGYTLAAPEG
jgi:UPF0271 protein